MRPIARAAMLLALGVASLVRADDLPEDSAPVPPPIPPVAVVPREGVASWYGPQFHGRLTACGERFHQDGFTAAHRTLPFGTLLNVTNLDTGCSVMVRVNDRGPYHGNRILDCSRAAAEELGFIDHGVARIHWEIIDPASIAGAPGRASRGASAPRSASTGTETGTGRALAPVVEPPRPMNTEEVSW